MHVSRRTAVAALAVAALGGSATTAVSAIGHDRGQDHRRGDHGRRDRDRHDGTLLATTLAPSVPTTSGGPTLNGIAPGGVPWVLKRGAATLSRHGELRAFVRGLVIPPPAGTGTPGRSRPCSPRSTATGAACRSARRRRSRFRWQGDASMSGMVTVPAKCLAPLVLVHPNANGAAYIAASGFGG